MDASPGAPSPTCKAKRPTNGLKQVVDNFENAVSNGSGDRETLQAILRSLREVESQFDRWAGDLAGHALQLEQHHASLYNAAVAVQRIEGKLAEVESSAKTKFDQQDGLLTEHKG